ncbi:MAG: hypothetical protein ACTSU9_20115 [Promethearchaeota archaeon]
MISYIEKRRERRGITPFKLEIMKLLSWSGASSLVFGSLLIMFWATFNYLEAAQQYLYFAAPVVTPRRLTIMLVLGIVSISNFALGLVARRGIVKDRKWARFMLLASGAMKVYIPPVGTYFGFMILSLGFKKNLNTISKSPERAYKQNEINQILLFNALFFACIGIFIILVHPFVYIFPVEFFDGEDTYTMRTNIWNVIYIIIAILEILIGIIVASHFLAMKHVKGWRACLWITCTLLAFVFPIGPHVAGIYYRTVLKKERT